MKRLGEQTARHMAGFDRIVIIKRKDNE